MNDKNMAETKKTPQAIYTFEMGYITTLIFDVVILVFVCILVLPKSTQVPYGMLYSYVWI